MVMKMRYFLGILALPCVVGFSSSALGWSGTLNFVGPCSDCSVSGGAGTATATVTVLNYEWGASLPPSVGFSYQSELLGGLAPFYAYNVTGSFASEASAPAAISLQFEIFGAAAGHYTFQSDAGGGWSLMVGSTPVALDMGNSHTWTAAVPEPETYAMLLAGLGLIGYVIRRRQCQAC
jgi:hypothetical protein